MPDEPVVGDRFPDVSSAERGGADSAAAADAGESRLRAQPLDIAAADAVRAQNLDWVHADPFDRVLAARSLLQHAALVTRDAGFGDLKGLRILW